MLFLCLSVAACPVPLSSTGLKAQLAAAHQVRSRNGDFAAVLGKGPLAVQELSRHMMDLEAAKQLLLQSSVKPLLTQVAQHNDCHIVVVSGNEALIGLVVSELSFEVADGSLHAYCWPASRCHKSGTLHFCGQACSCHRPVCSPTVASADMLLDFAHLPPWLVIITTTTTITLTG